MAYVARLIARAVRADPHTPAGRTELGAVASEVTDLVNAFPAYPVLVPA
jgi:glycine hydroxymethyltransferase